MLLRFQSRDGTFRLRVEPTDTFASISQSIVEHLPSNAVPESICVGDRPLSKDAIPLRQLAGVTFASKNLQ